VFIVPAALINGNPKTQFLVYLIVLALSGCAVVETLLFPLRSPYLKNCDPMVANAGYPNLMYVARIVAGVSVVADLIRAWLGGGTVFTQITGKLPDSPLVSVAGLMGGWKYAAVGFLLAAALGKPESAATALKFIWVLIGTQVVIAFVTALIQPLVNFIGFVAFVGLMLGAIRARFLLICVVVMLLSWPTVFAIRNSIRESKGVAVSDSVSAGDRLRFDLQVTRAAGFKVPAEVPGSPGMAEILRYGLVPRIIDADRPLLTTGARINSFLGGDATSSYTFLPLGTIYFLSGPDGVVFYFAFWALGVALLIRTSRAGPGPVRILILCLAVAGPLGWTSTYPDSTIGFVQSLISSLPLLWLLRTVGRRG
jgi:hypothetical protein